MRFFRYLAFGLMGAFLVLAGVRLRFAKITIYEHGGPRTLFRVCLPDREPDVFAMTERDFMCDLYDCYGFRDVGGFGLAAEGNTNRPPVLFPPSVLVGEVDEATAIAIARRSVATNDAKYPAWLAANVSYRARQDGKSWSVIAEMIVGTNNSGQPLTPFGGFRNIGIDERGGVTHYIRGR